jgi:YD repeat-containing protein
MKTCSLILFFVIGALISKAWARPVDLSAPSGLGATNLRGYLEIWRNIDKVGLQLDKGSYLPLRYKFSSEPNTGGVLGPGFYCPMFEAQNVLIRESTMRVYLPCGKALYFWRDAIDPNKFLTVDKAWTGYLQGDDYTIWRDDGWKVLYHKSRLASITSDDNHTFIWSYGEGDIPSKVTEDGQTAITVETNVAGQVAAFVFNGKRYEVEYGERPITQVLLGQVAIKELDQALSRFKYPDGKTEVFKFALTPQRTPTLTFTDPDEKQTVYTWDAATNYIASENGPEGHSTYQIGKITGSFGLPSITRTTSDGKSESIAIDTARGITTEQSLEGTTTVTTSFEAPGPLYGKVRQVTETFANGETLTLARLGYDESGRLIRKMDADGFVTTITYDTGGHIAKQVVLPPSAPAILNALKVREAVLLNDIASAKTPRKHDDAVYEIALFYIYRLGNLDKAAGLVQGIANKSVASDIQMHLILGNRNLTSAERVTRLQALLVSYPEKKDALSYPIALYQGRSG